MLRGALRGICPAEALEYPGCKTGPLSGLSGPGKAIISAGPAPPNGLRALLRTQYRRRGLEDPPGATKAVLRLSDPSAATVFTDRDCKFPLRARWPGPEGQKQPGPEPGGRNQAAGTRRPEPGGRNQAKKGQKPRRRRRETITPATGKSYREQKFRRTGTTAQKEARPSKKYCCPSRGNWAFTTIPGVPPSSRPCTGYYPCRTAPSA